MNQNKINYIVGKNIKKYRLLYNINNDCNITQEKLAELINVSVSTIGSLKKKKINRGISINNLYKISMVLDTPINKFFEDTFK